MNKKRFYLIFALFCIIWIIIFVNIYYLNFWQKKIAAYYYNKADYYLEQLDNTNSTDYLIKAMKMDPELNSQEYKDFQDKRRELLKDEDNYNKFFNENPE